MNYLRKRTSTIFLYLITNRNEVHRVVRLTVPISLTTLLDALEANTKRYPMDVLSIYRCLRDVGKRHDDYVETLVSDLLKLDKRYLPKEANVEDIMYTAYVILIVNACSSNVKMLHHLPKYIFRHFAYFKSKYPDCIPDLRVSRTYYKRGTIIFRWVVE